MRIIDLTCFKKGRWISLKIPINASYIVRYNFNIADISSWSENEDDLMERVRKNFMARIVHIFLILSAPYRLFLANVIIITCKQATLWPSISCQLKFSIMKIEFYNLKFFLYIVFSSSSDLFGLLTEDRRWDDDRNKLSFFATKSEQNKWNWRTMDINCVTSTSQYHHHHQHQLKGISLTRFMGI